VATRPRMIQPTNPRAFFLRWPRPAMVAPLADAAVRPHFPYGGADADISSIPVVLRIAGIRDQQKSFFFTAGNLEPHVDINFH
jgi:hypothetical protein